MRAASVLLLSAVLAICSPVGAATVDLPAWPAVAEDAPQTAQRPVDVLPAPLPSALPAGLAMIAGLACLRFRRRPAGD